MIKKLNFGKIFFLFIFSLINFNLYSPSLRHLLNSKKFPEVDGDALNLSEYNLSDIIGIEYYPKIETVVILLIRDNNIIDLSPLTKIKHLNIRYLDAGSNKIKNLAPLKNLKNLRYLFIDNNKINAANLLIALSLKKIEFVCVDGNPIDSQDYKLYKSCKKMDKNFYKNNYLRFFLDFKKNAVEEPKQFHEKNKENEEKEEVKQVEKKEAICAICHEPDNLVHTPCFHIFHQSCLDRWFESSNKFNCPMCRQDLAQVNLD